MAGMIESAFFGDLYSTAEMRAVWSDRAMIPEDPRVSPYLAEAELDTLLDPARYTGLAASFVDRVMPP